MALKVLRSQFDPVAQVLLLDAGLLIQLLTTLCYSSFCVLEFLLFIIVSTFMCKEIN